MLPDAQRVLAASLLVPPDGWPWEWSADGEAVIWQDGSTIVMREELALLVERLIPSGVSPIGPLMLLLAACRGKMADIEVLLEIMKRNAISTRPPVARLRLLDLSSIPRELLTGIPSKTSLITLVFAGAPKLKSDEAAAVLALLREGLPPSTWPITKLNARQRDLIAELGVLYKGLAPLDAAKIEHALRTGIPEAPGSADVELPLGERVALLVEELENDPEFPGLARLTRDVMAALTLPRALPRPDYDSPGGFADIGNRGQLHRLLLSELAHDDDTLAARIALGEALYLRREPASNPPPATLALLLDAGLRMWGTPRVFGAAVALACLAKAAASQGAVAFRANGAAAEPISLSTRAGLTSHLAALDTTLNPAASLAPLAAKLQPASGQLDVMIITHPLALEDPDFNAACAAMRGAGIRSATVDRDGTFAIHLRTACGWQPIAEARLKLDALFSAPSRRAMPRDPRLPAMLRDKRRVFRFPIAGKLRATCAVRGYIEKELAWKEYAVGVTDHGSIWEWSHGAGHGAWRWESVRLGGSLCELLFDDAESCVIAVGHETNGNRVNLIRHFCGANRRGTVVTELPKPMECPVRVWARGGHLFLGTDRQVHVINIGTGDPVGEAALLPGMSWLSGRFVARYVPQGRVFLAVTFDGTQVTFQGVMQRWTRQHAASVLRLFERDGIEGLWALDNMGRFFEVESGTLQLDVGIGALGEVRASRNGNRFWVRNTRKECKGVDLTSKRVTQSFVGEVNLDFLPAPVPWALRNKFTHIGLSFAGDVWLRAQKGYWVEIRYVKHSLTFVIELKLKGTEPDISVQFGALIKVPEHGCSLTLAELPGGSRAWLDSRGILHLQAADLFLPEISIVLAESTSLPVWSSDNTIVGPEYFIAPTVPQPADAEKLAAYLRSFVASCR